MHIESYSSLSFLSYTYKTSRTEICFITIRDEFNSGSSKLYTLISPKVHCPNTSRFYILMINLLQIQNIMPKLGATVVLKIVMSCINPNFLNKIEV